MMKNIMIIDYWKNEFQLGESVINSPIFSLFSYSGSDEDYSMSWLKIAEVDLFSCTPDLIKQLNLKKYPPTSSEELLARLSHANFNWYGADQIFYLSEIECEKLQNEPFSQTVRRLTQVDKVLFDEFCSQNSVEDLDGAYVELDHWRVMGLFEQEKLIAVASAYPWDDSLFADMGILTHPDHRQKGYAKLLIRALSKLILNDGYEPQYRCQLDNFSSLALAKKAGFSSFGQLDFILKNESDDDN
ncbi:GNAT family N-acetyltransferase [Proteus sp. ZN5]|uniref:GNAT family N-acetyltransferase n=1 Tax=Proteus sp. ZN5 TaxID=2697019 RepID=UPI0013E1974C|nr:GNAT family N-acetyltransferase [Proteus sp. ZN5]QIG06163.1 GNAT family N-acetyltransferase [Proteus sp. ZN5]